MAGDSEQEAKRQAEMREEHERRVRLMDKVEKERERERQIEAEMRQERERRIRQMEEEEMEYMERRPERRSRMMFWGRGGRSRGEDEYWKEEERRAERAARLTKRFCGLVLNNNHGYGYKLCDMGRLKRFITLGSEANNYYCTPKQILLEHVECVQNLIRDDHYQEVLDTVEQYAKEGRAPKDEPLLVVLAMCAVNPRKEVRKAAYAKINSTCSIPTQLFKFLELTHDDIVRRRIANPPSPQPFRRAKNLEKKKPEVGDSDPAVHEAKEEPCENVDDAKEEPCENVDDAKEEPCENVDETQTPRRKARKRKEKEFKLVNKKAKKSLGWGRMRRQAIAKFYTDGEKGACRLLYLLTKYKQRHNWSHQEVIKYTHPKMTGEHKDAKDLVVRYCTRGYDRVADEMKKVGSTAGLSEDMSEVLAYIDALNSVRNLQPDVDGDEDKLIKIMETYGRRSQAKEFTAQHSLEGSATKENALGRKSPIQIVREHIPTGFLNSVKVWECMLVDMPMTAMIRNLGKMSSLQMFGENSSNTKYVLDALGNEKRLQSARVHPMQVLIAAETYKQGKGDKGSLIWPVNVEILTALNHAFNKSFKSPAFGKTFKTNKKYMLAIDVSGSMHMGCYGTPAISASMAAAAMAMITFYLEDHVEIMTFSGKFQNITGMLKKSMTLQEAYGVTEEIAKVGFGGTDCSLPMVHALEAEIEVDVFIVYTDSETGYNDITPMDALRMYNIEMKRDAKLIVCAMSSAGFTIADPNYGNALDICGFDASVPELIHNFVSGDKDMKCNVCNGCKSVS